MHFVLPQVIESIVGLANDIPMYVNNATKLIDKLMTDLNLDEQYFNLAVDKWNEFVTYIIVCNRFNPNIRKYVKECSL